MRRTLVILAALVLGMAASVATSALAQAADKTDKPNVIVILADDVGYGDLGCYGATKVKTPNLDKLARQGIRFTDGYAPSATCTPTRYGLLTGQYPWRKPGTGILPGDAALIIEPGSFTLPAMMKKAGYTTGAVGKWHLGLGDGKLDWNGEIKPGPREIGFDYSFLIPATGDRVPCVYVENQRVVGLDPNDPIQVSYQEKVGDEPTGREHPEMLKMKLSKGHDFTIVNGISRIGYMTGGKQARWVDEDMADTIAGKAAEFIEKHQDEPFFLYFATHDVHVPRVPHQRFKGTSQCGVRGDVLQELDWQVGHVMETLDRLKLADNTIVIFTSDNGPVIDDGYADGATEDLNGHAPAGPLNGHKYSLFEGGTRVPFILRWPDRVKPGESSALVGQIDFLASLAALNNVALPDNAAPDSLNVLPALLGESDQGRDYVVEHANGLAIREGKWKLIPARQLVGRQAQNQAKKQAAKNQQGKKQGAKGAGPKAQLYDLSKDLGEMTNVAAEHPDVVAKLTADLEKIHAEPRTRK